DHGASPVPEVNVARRMPGGRMQPGDLAQVIQAALVKKYGEGKWILGDTDAGIYFDEALIAQKKLDPAEVERTASAAAMTVPHVFRVYGREQLLAGAIARDPVAEQVTNGYNQRRGADLEVLLDPYWITSKNTASHGTTFSYDAHVPLIFLGPVVKSGN